MTDNPWLNQPAVDPYPRCNEEEPMSEIAEWEKVLLLETDAARLERELEKLEDLTSDLVDLAAEWVHFGKQGQDKRLWSCGRILLDELARRLPSIAEFRS